MCSPRYYEVWASNETNRIDAVSEASGMLLVAIADDNEGGIIGYVATSHAALILNALNARKE